MFSGKIFSLTVETEGDKISTITLLEHTGEDSYTIHLDIPAKHSKVTARTLLEVPGKIGPTEWDIILVNDYRWTFNTLTKEFPSMCIKGKIMDLQSLAIYLNESMELSKYESPMFTNPITHNGTTAWKTVVDTYGFETDVVGIEKNMVLYRTYCKHIEGLASLFDRLIACE